MTVYLQDADVTIHQGDVLDVLRKLPDESVHMCCTSPPFYGLRDYGTGTWEGGDEGCDHVQRQTRSDVGRIYEGDGRPRAFGATEGATEYFKDTCGKCGARRVDQQIGLEATPDEWVARLVEVFREVRRVLRNDGTCWVEIGDSYAATMTSDRRMFQPTRDTDRSGGVSTQRDPVVAGQRTAVNGVKSKDLIGAPWLLAFALRAGGWYLRSEIIWAKPNPMPESVTDRPTTSHSRVFLLAKQPRYFYDAEAIKDPAIRAGDIPMGAWDRAGDGYVKPGWGNGAVPTNRNRRSVWTIATQPYPEAHFATWPEALCRDMILAGTSERGVCPECGAPWERVVERESSYDHTTTAPTALAERNDVNGDHDVRHGVFSRTTTTGWQPTCGHDLEPVPATVLDPFGGSGTTAYVARKLGRRAILIELSPDYCRLAAERLAQQSLLADAPVAAEAPYAVSALPPDKEKNPSDAPAP